MCPLKPYVLEVRAVQPEAPVSFSDATALAFEIRGDDAELAAAAPLFECLR